MRSCLQGPQQQHSRPTIRYNCSTWQLSKDGRMERISKPKDLVGGFGWKGGSVGGLRGRERAESAKCGLVLYFDLDFCLHMRYVYMYLLGELQGELVRAGVQQQHY